jgi:amino-acid N-acetyltransferase
VTVSSTRPNEDLVYRSAGSADEAAIRQLLAECGLPTSDLTVVLLVNFLVCRADGRVIGVVGVEPAGDAALLRSLAVAPGWRGCRVGRELVQRAEAHARGLGAEAVYLLTMTADRFFAALGYRTIARESAPASVRATAEFANLCPSTSVCMTKPVA